MNAKQRNKNRETAAAYDALCLTVYNGQDLGSVVPDYKPSTYREA